MKFLVSSHKSTANIYGHTYLLNPFNSSLANLNDILVTDNGTASELLGRHNDILSAVVFDTNEIAGFPEKLSGLDQIPAGSKIMVLRSGGIGDHIMFLPALKGLKKFLSHRDVMLWLAVQKDMFPLFMGQRFIDRLFPLPLPMINLIQADYYVDFSDSIQESGFNSQHPVDYNISSFGLLPAKTTEKTARLNMNGRGSRLITQLFNVIKEEYKDRPLILMQWLASVNLRSLPPESLSALTRKNRDFLFISAHHHTQAKRSAGDITTADMNVIDISCHIRDLSDFITAVNMSDGVISTDSSAYHVAAALDKPALAIFGPITSGLRTSYYPKVVSIDAHYKGNTCSSPCYTQKGVCREVKLMGTPYSPCLLSISESLIHDKFRELVRNYL